METEVSSASKVILRIHGILSKKMLGRYDTSAILLKITLQENVLILVCDYSDQAVPIDQVFNYLGYETKLIPCKSKLIKTTEWSRELPEVLYGHKSVSAFEVENKTLFVKHLPIVDGYRGTGLKIYLST